MLTLLWRVQKEFAHISSEAEFWVSRLLELPVSHVREVVSFYSMFRTTEGGRHELRVCTSLPCMLRGADDVLADLKECLGVAPGETTPGGELTLTEVECLCACEIAPMAQLDEEFLGPLETGALGGILRESSSPGRSHQPKPFICTDGPVLSNRFLNEEGTWWDAYVAEA